MAKRVLRTKLCDLLGIEYPILSAGMGPTLIGERTGAPVELVVAVSEAGGLGVLGGSGYTVDELREAIRQIKAQTDKPFGVDLLLPQKLDLGGGLGQAGVDKIPLEPGLAIHSAGPSGLDRKDPAGDGPARGGDHGPHEYHHHAPPGGGEGLPRRESPPVLRRIGEPGFYGGGGPCPGHQGAGDYGKRQKRQTDGPVRYRPPGGPGTRGRRTHRSDRDHGLTPPGHRCRLPGTRAGRRRHRRRPGCGGGSGHGLSSGSGWGPGSWPPTRAGPWK